MNSKIFILMFGFVISYSPTSKAMNTLLNESMLENQQSLQDPYEQENHAVYTQAVEVHKGNTRISSNNKVPEALSLFRRILSLFTRSNIANESSINHNAGAIDAISSKNNKEITFWASIKNVFVKLFGIGNVIQNSTICTATNGVYMKEINLLQEDGDRAVILKAKTCNGVCGETSASKEVSIKDGQRIHFVSTEKRGMGNDITFSVNNKEVIGEFNGNNFYGQTRQEACVRNRDNNTGHEIAQFHQYKFVEEHPYNARNEFFSQTDGKVAKNENATVNAYGHSVNVNITHEMKETMDHQMRKNGYDPKKIAEATGKSIEGGRGQIISVTSEQHITNQDIQEHRQLNDAQDNLKKYGFTLIGRTEEKRN